MQNCRTTFGGKRRFACPNKQTAKQFAGQAKCGGTKTCRGRSPNTFLWSLAAQRAAYFYRFVTRRTINAPLSYYSVLLYNYFLYNKFILLSYYRNISLLLCIMKIYFITFNFYFYLITLCFQSTTPKLLNQMSRVKGQMSRVKGQASRV